MNRRIGRVLPWVAALLVGLAATAATVDCPRIVAIGDLHGGVDNFNRILRETGLVDEQRRWIAEDSCLVQIGDVVDRGPRSRELLDQLMALRRTEQERVFPLLGNHEAMNIVGDLRYVSPGEFAAFSAEETTQEREQGFASFLEMWGNESSPKLRTRFDKQFPPGWFAHRRAFSPEGRYGSWLLGLPAALVLGDTLFVHGGLTAADAARGIREVNAAVTQGIRDYSDLRSRLVDAGVLNPLVSFSEGFALTELWLGAQPNNGDPSADPTTMAAARRFLALQQADFVRQDGPLWNRDLARRDELEYQATFDETLRALDVNRIVVGHTQPDDPRIAKRFHSRAYLIDTGAGPAYEGRVSALELTAATIRAIYPGESETLAEIPLPDEQIERMLSEGRILSIEEIGTGISKPKRMELEWDGRRRKAAFKNIDIQKSGELTRFERAPTQFNFSDSYKYERAAYLLDRHLGMNMIPVAVFREIEGEEGAVVDWIGDAVNEQERREQGLQPEDPRVLTTQRDLMQAFDALILNTDRNLANQLWTPADWKLHLIDHSRSFNLIKKLPKTIEGKTVTLPRWFYDAIKALEQKEIAQALGGLISGAQIKAMLSRRDKLVKQIDADIEKYGESMVLY